MEKNRASRYVHGDQSRTRHTYDKQQNHVHIFISVYLKRVERYSDPMELLADNQLGEMNGSAVSYASTTTVTLTSPPTAAAPPQKAWLAVTPTPPASQEKR